MGFSLLSQFIFDDSNARLPALEISVRRIRKNVDRFIAIP